MCLLIGFLLLTALLFGLAVAVHALWWLLLVMVALWLVGFLFRPRGRWRF
ncbi:MAG: hydrophobic protein [Candidatus Dormibacteraeota bacterium]|nr:hydrophobic protein [Candidatus Dormibacteraeota bacterium]MBV8446325.1 hydrophobic protein [Candidatus Dormibacteraeota bacterium]